MGKSEKAFSGGQLGRKVAAVLAITTPIMVGVQTGQSVSGLKVDQPTVRADTTYRNLL